MTIGRTTDDGTELSHADWHRFEREALRCVQRFPAAVLARTQGRGAWGDHVEDSAVIIGEADRTPREVRDRLTPQLARLAVRYGQDAVGLIIAEPGAPTLVPRDGGA